MINAKEVENENPICPYCLAELKTINFKKIESTFGKRYIYFCPTCKKSLGVTQRKGFWMG